MNEWSYVPSAAFLDEDLTALGLRVLGVIAASIETPPGYCRLKQSEIAAALGVGREAVNRSVRMLVDRGYLHSEAGAGMRRAHRYRILTGPSMTVAPGLFDRAADAARRPPLRMPRARYQKTPIKQSLRVAVFERDGYACRRCGSQQGLQADHVVPESRGGATTLSNLQTLCALCNRKRGWRLPEPPPT